MTDLDAIRAAFDRFVPIAGLGLQQMLSPGRPMFCFRAKRSPQGLELEGLSERYTAMSLIGLASHFGSGCELDESVIAEALHAWAPKAEEIGDVGLVLWSEVLRRDPRADDTAAIILRRKDELFRDECDRASMETGFLLIGLSEAIRANVGGPQVRMFAADVATALQSNQHPSSHLFSFTRKLRRKNIHRARLDHRLGSFASQVYPTMGFAAFARAVDEPRALQVARRCADRLVDLQGEEGQWWWIYHTHNPAPAIRYPVYTVHQDAMGPMALLAVALAEGGSERYDPAIAKSFAWFDERVECPEDDLVAPDLGVVWRAVQRDEPDRTGRLGLGAGELARMGRAGWFGTVDKRDTGVSHVCPECRPYHLGWILLAAGMFAERSGT